MSAAHTPGPWSVGTYKEHHAVTLSDGRICCTTGYIGASDEDESVANAHLISAAPQLLAAIEALFDADMEHVLMVDGKYDQIDAIAMGHAAIAKATGAAA